MTKANYIIFHPDSQREKVQVSATILENGIQKENWRGSIWVDSLSGNEDPFVFTDPWLYSYCHATQLRRGPREDGIFLQKGSWILFCSGDMVSNGNLVFDTLFLIENICRWTPRPNLALPFKFSDHFRNSNSHLWRRHFRYPFHGYHNSATHTYEGRSWSAEIEDYSFLPYSSQGERVKLSLLDLDPAISNKIKRNLYGRRPVLLMDEEITPIVRLIQNAAVRRVVKNINLWTPPKEADKLSCC